MSQNLKATIWKDPRKTQVLATGHAYPGPPETTEALFEKIDTVFKLNLRRRGLAVAKRLGIKTRHISRKFESRLESPYPTASNPELCQQALDSALRQAGLKIDDVGYLIGHTATPHELLPSNISKVATLMNYHGPFAEFRQACTGFVNATVFAMGLTAADPDCIVAIVGSEVGSVFFDPVRASEDNDQLVNMVQMGDGAGAILLKGSHSIQDQRSLNSPKNIEAKAFPTLSHIFHGQMGVGRPSGLKLSTGGSGQVSSEKYIPEFKHDFESIRENGLALFASGLSAARHLGIEPMKCDLILPHQANGKMDQVLSPLLPGHSGIITHGKNVGNTGSAAIWLALDECRQKLSKDGTLFVLGAEATQYMYGGFLYEA
ncbi:MAG: 3-oxoacyl-ACP synthase [Cyanobacteria bacterium]|nr:3-oxoacyl-ACP synthase [Cyanobacteriota bacterium]